MDPIVGSVVSELKQVCALPRTVIFATCSSTESFVGNSVFSRRRDEPSSGKMKRNNSGENVPHGSVGRVNKLRACVESEKEQEENRTHVHTSRTLDNSGLECFDHLLFIPLELDEIRSVALLLQQDAKGFGYKLAPATAKEAATLMNLV
jgi:hypothetical protein